MLKRGTCNVYFFSQSVRSSTSKCRQFEDFIDTSQSVLQSLEIFDCEDRLIISFSISPTAISMVSSSTTSTDSRNSHLWYFKLGIHKDRHVDISEAWYVMEYVGRETPVNRRAFRLAVNRLLDVARSEIVAKVYETRGRSNGWPVCH